MNNKEALSLAGLSLVESTNTLVVGLSDLLQAQAYNLTHIVENVDKNALYTKEELLETNERITAMMSSVACLEDTISQKLTLGEELLKGFNPEFSR